MQPKSDTTKHRFVTWANAIAITLSALACAPGAWANGVPEFRVPGGVPVYDYRVGGNGSADGQFTANNGICVDSDGNFYVADALQNRIQKFDASGNLLLAGAERVDLIRVPRGTHHWFDLCGDRTVRAIRLFQDVSGWTPHYTNSGKDAGYEPVCFGAAFIPVSKAI